MWQPIPLNELEALIARRLVECTPESHALYELNAIPRQKWAPSPWGDAGGGFWAIAILGNSVLWYNDIEDGSNTSTYMNEGKIEHYWCHQDTLHIALLGLIRNSPQLGAPDVLA